MKSSPLATAPPITAAGRTAAAAASAAISPASARKPALPLRPLRPVLNQDLTVPIAHSRTSALVNDPGSPFHRRSALGLQLGMTKAAQVAGAAVA